ncbi:hypothetical protein Peur_027806 [Populus x canadensis]
MAIHCYIFSFNKFQWKRRNIIISPLLSRRRRQPPSLPMTSASRSSIQDTSTGDANTDANVFQFIYNTRPSWSSIRLNWELK